MSPQQFRNLVWRHAKAHGRHDLPWRNLPAGRQERHTTYRILVSEVMLQQTQVERVIPYYRNFLRQFPTPTTLASAPLSNVLKSWQGLGYNRRAKMLHEAAKIVVQKHTGKVPTDVLALEALPGVGPYTARAVAAFASNTDVIFIETNIRTVITHHFFPINPTPTNHTSPPTTMIYHSGLVSDGEIRGVLEKVYPEGRAREWYGALMDYGAHLKKSGVRLNAQAKGYSKQKTFKGSAREARGTILKELVKGSATKARLMGLLGTDRQVQIEAQLMRLVKEGMIRRQGVGYSLPG